MRRLRRYERRSRPGFSGRRKHDGRATRPPGTKCITGRNSNEQRECERDESEWDAPGDEPPLAPRPDEANVSRGHGERTNAQAGAGCRCIGDREQHSSGTPNPRRPRALNVFLCDSAGADEGIAQTRLGGTRFRNPRSTLLTFVEVGLELADHRDVVREKRVFALLELF